jgi:serine/threonine-protein kinase Chk2
VYLVTERMEKDMCEYIITSPNRYLDEETCKILIYQVIVALRYLHDNGCGHLDVKCENILISMLKPVPAANSTGRPPSGIDLGRDYPLVKLADFGYTRQIGEHSFRKTCVGTVSQVDM